MEFKNPYLSNVQRANLLQQWILVHSALYYELDKPFVSDNSFDENSKQLVELMSKMSREEKEKTRFYYVFRGFEGSTGFYLCSKLTKEHRRMIFEQAECASWYASK